MTEETKPNSAGQSQTGTNKGDCFAFLFFRTITELHHGAGTSEGIIDRPLRRERITSFPMIQSASLKGALRAEFNESLQKILFGDKDPEGAGIVHPTNVQLLAFPVRSLKGLFLWVTCPLLLYRFRHFVELGLGSDKVSKLTAFLNNPPHQLADNNNSSVYIVKSSQKKIALEDNNNCWRVYLEDNPFKVLSQAAEDKYQEAVGEIAGLIEADGTFQQKLVLISDDNFKYLITHATDVIPNIRIKPDTGTQWDGSLRYTEYLPAETWMYSLLRFTKPYKSVSRKDIKDSESARKVFTGEIVKKANLFQLGGDETIGKGWLIMTIKHEQNESDGNTKAASGKGV